MQREFLEVDDRLALGRLLELLLELRIALAQRIGDLALVDTVEFGRFELALELKLQK